MGFVGFFYPWGIILQLFAVVHFIRRRPDTSWLWVILVFGPPGALIYIFVEIIPDISLLRQSYDSFGRRKKIRHLEALVRENPSPGNYEELAEMYLDEKKFARARECYDKVLARPGEYLDAHYRRAIAALQLGDAAGARPDLELVVAREPKYDSHRAMALLAHASAQTGDAAQAGALFARVTEASTLPETYYNYASFLASQGRSDEARTWAQRIIAHRDAMPLYVRRRERPWFRKAKGLLKRLPG
ncbi:MAG TPA: tetratricopeptide repeat protein [Vicinamibacterales bacterium]|jgi:hypothetical protein|nr:tetratricopeptide repeat protein [Vicinamibacterales bacterium]